MTAGRRTQTKLTSSALVSRPREKRTRQLARVLLPQADMTGDGSSEPAEQAEPLEAQIPSISSPPSKTMLSVPSTTKEIVLTNRCSREPTNSVPRILETQSIN